MIHLVKYGVMCTLMPYFLQAHSSKSCIEVYNKVVKVNVSAHSHQVSIIGANAFFNLL